MTDVVTQPMCVHPHDFDRNIANPDPIFTVRVQALASAPGEPRGVMFGRLTDVIDENGNLWPLIGLDPGLVTRCGGCHREVYIPDAAAESLRLGCPYRDCTAFLDRRPQIGDLLVDDAPGQTVGGDCLEHGMACHAPKVQTEVVS